MNVDLRILQIDRDMWYKNANAPGVTECWSAYCRGRYTELENIIYLLDEYQRQRNEQYLYNTQIDWL